MNSRTVFVIGSLFALACTKSVDHPGSASATRTVESCPLGVPGATVATEDTAEGIALLFLSHDRTEELRERVHYAAAMHGPSARLGIGHDGHHGEGGDHGLQAMQLPPVYAGVDEFEGGARLRLVPADAADLEKLRDKVRARATRMTASTCVAAGDRPHGARTSPVPVAPKP